MQTSTLHEASSAVLGHQEQGQGTALFLIPGLAGLGRFWEPVVPELCGRFRVISVDHPGMGASAHLFSESVESIAMHVVRLADSLGIPHFHIIGHSTGGAVAQALAIHHNERCRQVVLSNTWAQPDQRFADLFELRQVVLEGLGQTAYGRLTDLLAYPGSLYERYATRRTLKDADASTRQNDPSFAATMSRRIDMLMRFDLSHQLHAIQTSVLVVGAPDDSIVSFDHSQKLARAIDGARLVEVHGGHFSPRTNTSIYADVINAFLREDKHGQ